MKKILLVDDDPELRQLLATYLGRHGYDTLLLPDTRQLDAMETSAGGRATRRLNNLPATPYFLQAGAVCDTTNGETHENPF